MQINLYNSTKNNIEQYGERSVAQALTPALLFSPSFKMKMSELKGIDKFVARKYKINPQPIKTLQEFQEKCKELVEKISVKDFSGRQKESQVQRKAMINDWYDYVVKENGAYTGAMALMILGGITAGLKPKEDTLPPVLNKGVLADTVTKIEDELKGLKPNEEAQINFDKQYRLNLQKGIFRKEKALDESLNGWIIIPSKEHDPNNFEANVDKLKMLSHDNWCTKSFNAEPSLEKGDFHVYMEQGKPKLGVRFVRNEIQEIQGELNNSKIPLKYEDIAKEHINNYKLSFNVEYELTALEKTKAKVEEIQKNFPNGINNYPVEKIFEKFGIKCEQDEDGFFTISHYNSMIDNISFSDIGIDENRLIKNVKRIEGDANFYNSQITSLGHLESIGGYAGFRDSKIKSLGNLRLIGGNADFSNSLVTDLSNLESIGGDAGFRDSKITSLDNLKSIGGNAYFRYSQVTDLGKLKLIGGNADFSNSLVTDLSNLESIGRWAYFVNSQVTDLGKLKLIGGDVFFRNSQITSLGNLRSIGGFAVFENSQITNLGNLRSIGGYADFENSKITSLGNLKSIGKDVFIKGSKLKPEDFASVKVGGEINK